MTNQRPMSLFKVAMTLLTAVTLFITAANSSKILCLMPLCPRSHYIVFAPLVEALASHGHQVTVMSPFKTFNVPNVEDVEIANSKRAVTSSQRNVYDYLIGKGDSSILSLFHENMKLFCHAFLTDVSFKHLLKKGKYYDLVIVDGVVNECAFTIAPLVAKQVITLNPTGQVPWVTTSSPMQPSSVPMVVLPYSSNMSFFQRLWNTWIQLYNRLYFQHISVPAMEQIAQEHFSQALSVAEATGHVALTLANTDPVLFSPRPHTPDLVLVGAMHCRPARPLPQEFTDFIEKDKGQGAIVFSFGSFVPAKYMPAELRNAFVAAFARLKQVVFWKYEEALLDLPPNVMTTSWLPQQDLLGNNHTRLFITHGGLLSCQEAVYHGVPMIAVPLYYDQVGNAARIRELGIGESLDLKNITADGIYDTIQRILNHQRYYDNMRKSSSVLRDQPQTPTDRAVYWVEYVIRHKGAHHLKSPALELNFFQYFLLDVIAFAILAVAIVVTLLAYCVRRFVYYWENPVKILSQKRISYPKIYSETTKSK